MYIRFGDIPEDECSSIYWRGEFVGKENGVSVYDAKIDDWGNLSVCLPLPINRNTLDTFRSLVEYDDRPCYLVTGDYVGKGTDNEPLIKNITVIEKIEKYRDNKEQEENLRERYNDVIQEREKAED